jgi:8-oxo-dGTP diphosphatase
LAGADAVVRSLDSGPARREPHHVTSGDAADHGDHGDGDHGDGDHGDGDHDHGDPGGQNVGHEIPRIPASAGALIFDRAGRLLVLKPTYKSGWTVPGGQMESDGETPWEACRREAREETGLAVEVGRLVCVDFLRPRPGRPGGMRFLFDCGAFDDETLAGIVVQEDEISEYRLEELDRALERLSGPVRRRVRASAGARSTVYLEDGRRVGTVTDRFDDAKP